MVIIYRESVYSRADVHVVKYFHRCDYVFFSSAVLRFVDVCFHVLDDHDEDVTIRV